MEMEFVSVIRGLNSIRFADRAAAGPATLVFKPCCV
jgi:hypothetical protein